ncbi:MULTISPECIES: DUF2283 domain-containing protein [unclassified Micrococcus]|uniref:DUF2283 domain-containing protein n=1 Tax=unclassified Micrococcus TaxID=2620948 RepID=UPI00077DF112|nr:MULTISPECIES: DUF2283 domain-containing protein [unclassified Micrococcus]KYK00857.1 hypothetical protein AUV02_07800 [Micrococcus sp. CH3]KYK04822.1 hypothetical protein AUV08_01460 [Micrococcus sp. CH7]
MKLHEVTYDQEYGLGYARLGEGIVDRTVSYGDAVAVDFAADGSVYGLEVFGSVHEIPVTAMVDHFGWDNEIWSCLSIAARQLEALIEAPRTAGSDGTFRPAGTWHPTGQNGHLTAA